MEENIGEIRKKLAKKRKDILENSRKMNEQLDRLKLEEVKSIAKEISDLFPGGVSQETFEQIVTVIAKYQKKHEDAIQKFLEINRQKQIIELSNISIDDESYWPKISAAKALGIPVPEVEELIELSLKTTGIKSKPETK